MLKSHYHDIAKNQDKHWWYLGMATINKSLLDKYLTKKGKLKILDAGCGPGSMLLHLKRYGDTVGVDLSDEALKYAKKRGKAVKGDITKLKFKNNSFDAVVCMDVLYHTWVADELAALKQFHRVLKKGGILLIREPAYNWMRGNEDRGSLTARRFSREVLTKKLRQTKFRVLKVSYANFFLFPIVLTVRMLTMLGIIKGSSDMAIPNKRINSVLFGLLKLEAKLMKHVSLPFGSSLISVATKVS